MSDAAMHRQIAAHEMFGALPSFWATLRLGHFPLHGDFEMHERRRHFSGAD
jgi:hypothetical protein